MLVEILTAPLNGLENERSPCLSPRRYALSSSVPSKGFLSYFLRFSLIPFSLASSNGRLWTPSCLQAHEAYPLVLFPMSFATSLRDIPLVL